MAAALAGMALVSTGWTISDLVGTNGHRNHSSPLVEALFLVMPAVFSQEEPFASLTAQTIESLLMSGCGQGHKLPENDSKKLWLLFPVLSRSGNADERRYP